MALLMTVLVIVSKNKQERRCALGKDYPTKIFSWKELLLWFKVSPKQLESCYNNFIQELGKDRSGIIIVGLHEKDGGENQPDRRYVCAG